jgi:hypothetical protein
MSEQEKKTSIEAETERYEHVLSWMQEMYMNGRVPTLEGICRSFGLTPAEALACLAEFHKRFPIAFPITFQVASMNPRLFWGFATPLFGRPSRKVKRLGPPGVAVSRPYRRLALLLFVVGMVLMLTAGVLMALYGGVP